MKVHVDLPKPRKQIMEVPEVQDRKRTWRLAWLGGLVLSLHTLTGYLVMFVLSHSQPQKRQKVPVIGFNSAKYDANIMKMYLSETLLL